MITLDPRTPNERNQLYKPEYGDLLRCLQALQVPVQEGHLDFGDASLMGWGPGEIPVMVGAEIKKVGDALQCIKDGRFSGHQLPGMVRCFKYRYLIIEGSWKPDEYGNLVVPRQGGWASPGTSMRASGFARWLQTMGVMAGFRVVQTYDRRATAQYIADLWHWWSRPWGEHDSHLQMEEVEADPAQDYLDLTKRAPHEEFALKVAKSIPGVGRLKAKAVAEHFGYNGRAITNAGAKELQEVKGVGKGIAQTAVKVMNGGREQ